MQGAGEREGQRDVPADIPVPRESERHAGREVGQRGQRDVPADIPVPREPSNLTIFMIQKT